MRYVVNEGCIGCGACEGVCSEIFIMNDEGLAEAKDMDVPDELEAAAAEAKDGCPVNVIEEEE